MKKTLLILIFAVISISASAQAYGIQRHTPQTGVGTGSAQVLKSPNLNQALKKKKAEKEYNCKYRQCTAIAKSTGYQCRHCVSNSWDYTCWQH